MPRGVQRDLHQPRAIDAEAALAAPQIGRADESFGHRDEIASYASMRADMLRRQIPALARDRERPCLARTVIRAPSPAPRRRQFDRRAGKGERPERRDLVRRRGGGLRQRAIGKPADITVAVRLAPGPAFAIAS